MDNDSNPKGIILLTGASGYVGGHLLGVLERQGRSVRCLARNPEALRPQVAEATEVNRGDVFDFPSLRKAMNGVHAAYYLVHSMAGGEDFVTRDRQAAENFARAARESGVRRIIYLGGLGHGSDLSAHLASRHEVGRILRDSGVPTIEFRASIIIGAGSLSFEMVRALVHKLPIMVTPRWVATQAQPIAIEDVLGYLTAALEIPCAGSVIYEIGGPDRLSYLDLMKEYTSLRRVKRLMIPVPVLSPYLSSLWLSLFTPMYARVGRHLIEGVRNETIVRNERALGDFALRPMSVREAMQRAVRAEEDELNFTRWPEDGEDAHRPPGRSGVRRALRRRDIRFVEVDCPPKEAFAPIRRIGGERGWYFADMLWQLRGVIDWLAGGVGLRCGRRDPETVVRGDTIDFWRVETFEPDRLLRLRAEMKLPGRAWLQFEVQPEKKGSLIRQTAVFEPAGVAGLLYWYALYPLHVIIFTGMLRAIAREGRIASRTR